MRRNVTFQCQGPWNFTATHGTVTALNAPLLRVVSRAYNLTDDRVSGPAWMESECYDIKAKASGNASDQGLTRMLQSLLIERFHLVAHPESGERAILALVVDSGGSKLRPYNEKNNSAAPAVKDGRILFMARHLPDLCERLDG